MRLLNKLDDAFFMPAPLLGAGIDSVLGLRRSKQLESFGRCLLPGSENKGLLVRLPRLGAFA